MKKFDPQMSVQQRGGLVRVNGSSAVHHAIRMASAVPKRRPGQPSRPEISPLKKRFTLRIPGVKPAQAVLQAVCKASGINLETSAATADRLMTPVTLSVEDQLVTEIIQSVCRQAGLSVSFEDDTAIVIDDPSGQ
ncbi:MAG: hypothetical protein R3C05_02300 [Pirellulaceae bacterium]